MAVYADLGRAGAASSGIIAKRSEVDRLGVVDARVGIFARSCVEAWQRGIVRHHAPRKKLTSLEPSLR